MTEPFYDVIYQSAIGAGVTALLGVGATWLAHRRGWLAKPAAALGAWLRAESGPISQAVAKEVGAAAEPMAVATPVVVPHASWSQPDYDPKRGGPG